MRLEDIARQVVALPGWQWMEGMLAVGEGCCRYCHTTTTTPVPYYGPLRIVRVEGIWLYLDPDGEFIVERGAVPDLRDCATGGCLLELLGLGFGTYRDGHRWYALQGPALITYGFDDVGECGQGAALAEACARAALSLGRWPGSQPLDR